MSSADGDARLHSNRILSLLPAAEHQRLAPHFRYVELPLREVLYRPDEHISYVYFPPGGTVSVTAPIRDGHEAEVGVVGREGMAGLPVFLGTDSAPFRAVVQVAGGAVRIKAGAFRAEVARGGELSRLLLRYAQAFFVQAAQTAACNRLHSMEGRLAKWLLTTRDRVRSDELELTQEFLSILLGVRRAGVSEAVGVPGGGWSGTHAGELRSWTGRGLRPRRASATGWCAGSSSGWSRSGPTTRF